MRPEAFIAWLADMKAAGLARSDADCAKMLGISANGLLKRKKQGASLETSLACRALLHRMEPYA
jgi:hypothetical protein